MLDKRRYYGSVSGEDVAGAKWYQDGHYFDAAGKYLFSNPGLKAPAGDTTRSLDEARELHRAKEAAKAKPQKQVAPPIPPQKLPEGTQQAEGLDRRQQLMQMSYFALADLVKKANGEEIKGSGAKARMVEWLLANTK